MEEPAPAVPRVGIVVVSHSREIALGTVELARQMAGPDVRIVAAGGAADGSLGTDATRIAEAIREADSGAGVLVVADLGSAILATRTALTLMGAEGSPRIRLSRGPLVEGTVMAAVQASIGDPLEAVTAAADGAATLDKLAE
jgi:PTS hybrid protein